MLNFLKHLKEEEAEEKRKIEQLKQQRTELEADVKRLSERQNVLQEQNTITQSKIDKSLEAFRIVESGFNVLEEIGYERYIPNAIDDDIEKKIYQAECKMSTMACDNIIQYTRDYRIDGSENKGHKFQESFGKNLLIGFNVYVQTKTKSITENNYYHSCELIKKAFEKYNRQGRLLGIGLNEEYLNLRLEILKYTLELKIKKAKEKEQLREERRRMREQERLLEEARKEKEKLEAQRKAEDIAYAKALTDEERAQIKASIEALDKRINDIDYRVNNPKAGWVYIIHSPSLPGMVKIGVSRRLNGPYERISELSSSSLPFPFVLDGFCFSDDSFAVESAMHNYFDKQRVSANREFFYITANEAIDILSNRFNQTVIFDKSEKNGGLT